jgi:hypothetical protein
VGAQSLGPQDETRVAAIPINKQVMSGKNLFIGYSPIGTAAPTTSDSQ